MKQAKILAIAMGMALLMLFIREDRINFSPLDILPFFSNRPVDVYDFGGLAMLAIVLIAAARRPRI